MEARLNEQIEIYTNICYERGVSVVKVLECLHLLMVLFTVKYGSDFDREIIARIRHKAQDRLLKEGKLIASEI